MGLAILGLGTAVPPSVVDQPTASAIAARLCGRTDEHRTWLPQMYQQTGIRSRHMQFEPALIRDILEGTRHSGSIFLPLGEHDASGPTTGQRMAVYRRHAAELAVRAARSALDRAALAPGDITHLVTVSCTGFHAPGFDLTLVARLPLPATVTRVHVGFMGCHGAINALKVARAFLEADPTARVLLCATELCSLHYHYGWDPQKLVANALFADGAAALVGVAPEAAPARAWRVSAEGSCVLPDSAEAMTWSIGDHGFEMSLSKQVPALIRQHLRPWLTGWLADGGIGLDEVGGWAVHPGGPRILEAVEEALGLPRQATDVSREILAEYGNMSSPTVLFILDRLMRRGTPGPCVMLGFGPGLAAEAALVRTGETASP